MKLGIFTPVFRKLTFEQMLTRVRSLGNVEAIELGTGGWPGSDHVAVDHLLATPRSAKEYRSRIQDAGLTISALSCHGNPLHPDSAVARRDDEIFRKTVALAEILEVPVVVTFSGCPGDSDMARCPNWITCPWPSEFLDILDWQWEQKVFPYWREASQFANDHGIKVALEPHPGFVVYNAETALKLREEIGDSIGVNFDPSHLFWQGVDVAVAIRALGEAIFHVHAKDVSLDRLNVARNGVIDTKGYDCIADRSWLFRTVGWGHDELEWKRIVTSLRLIQYDYVLSIEHEDALMSIDEGIASAVTFLQRVMLAASPAEAWWI
jgi:sugar phosphate isomerase/epimerase